MIYHVWHPDDEGFEDAMETEAASPEDAASDYAATVWRGVGNDSVDLMVKDEDGNEFDITVEISFEPQFFAYGKKVK